MIKKIAIFGLLAAIFTTTCLLAVAQEASRFKVAGVIKALPGKGLAANEILVKHAEISDYRDSSGKVVGMMAMTMPFYLAPQAALVDSNASTIALHDLSIGDKVELEVEQRFVPKFEEQVVTLTKVK
jgi:Cu/Ag efflux protein CusF